MYSANIIIVSPQTIDSNVFSCILIRKRKEKASQKGHRRANQEFVRKYQRLNMVKNMYQNAQFQFHTVLQKHT